VSDTTDLLDAPTAGTSGDAAAEQSATKPARKRSAGLSGMVLAELQGLAGELGISGTAKMRKGQLIEAIKERQSGASGSSAAAAQADFIVPNMVAEAASGSKTPKEAAERAQKRAERYYKL